MQYIFPYHLFHRGDRVVIYGTGAESRAFYAQAMRDDYVKVVGIVGLATEGAKAAGAVILGDNALETLSYDYILISTHEQEKFEQTRANLLEHGIPERTIRWDGGTYRRDDFYRNFYLKLMPMVNVECQPHWVLLNRLFTRMKGGYRHIFPYHLFRRNERIVIYGAGDIGREFYRQAQEYDYIEVVAIVDRGAEDLDMPDIPAAPIEAIKQFDFDAVLISVHGREMARSIRDGLVRMGIPADKIRWDGTSYFRDEFFGKYFAHMDFLHEMAASKI